MFTRRILRIFASQYLYSKVFISKLNNLDDQKSIIETIENHRKSLLKIVESSFLIIFFWYEKSKKIQQTRDCYKHNSVSFKNILQNPYMSSIYRYYQLQENKKKNSDNKILKLQNYSNIIFNKNIKDNHNIEIYLNINNPTIKDHTKFIEEIAKIIFKNEIFDEYFEQINYNYMLEKSTYIKLMKIKFNILKKNNFKFLNLSSHKDINCIEENDFFYKLVSGVNQYYEFIHNLIFQKIENWKEERLEVYDKVLIFLGVYEIIFLKNPKSIVINEYIEISKIYCTPYSKNFINGVLDQINIEKNV